MGPNVEIFEKLWHQQCVKCGVCEKFLINEQGGVSAGRREGWLVCPEHNRSCTEDEVTAFNNRLAAFAAHTAAREEEAVAQQRRVAELAQGGPLPRPRAASASPPPAPMTK